MTDYAAIAKHLLRKVRPDVMAVYFEGVDTAGHMYMRYAPPAYPYATAEEQRAFGTTVDAFYRYQDRLLGELLALTDEKTTVLVVSDHGFLTGRQRPIEQAKEVSYATAARWHRIDGVFIARGPSIRKRADATAPPLTCPNASVFDITPTLLAVLGLPVGSDMEGRVLQDIFVPGFTTPAPLASYEDDAWRQSRAAAATTTEGVDEAMKERLRSLGYIGANESEAILSLRGQWSLADYFLQKGDLGRAEKELTDLVRRAPEWPEPYYNLGLAHMYRKDYERARAMYEKTLELDPTMIDAAMNLAFVYRQLGQRDKAIALLERTTQSEPYHAGARVNLAILYREAGQLDKARTCIEEALRLNPENFGAVVQAALTYEASGQYEKAAGYWSRALELNPQDATARQHLDALRAGHAPPSAGP
jgi:tetratricopeptide (TPR) repeat protein